MLSHWLATFCVLSFPWAFKISFQEKYGLVFLHVQELERLEVERVEMIRQHLCQYTQLRHETDMFNQSVSLLVVWSLWSLLRFTWAERSLSWPDGCEKCISQLVSLQQYWTDTLQSCSSEML